MQIVDGVLEMILRGLEKRLKDLQIRQQHWWDGLEYWRESWSPVETWCHSNASEKKKLPRSEIIFINSRNQNNPIEQAKWTFTKQILRTNKYEDNWTTGCKWNKNTSWFTLQESRRKNEGKAEKLIDMPNAAQESMKTEKLK